ncbi:AAA family ATPase [Brucella anthropi]|uniref:AAA family ATPase n=1 Tax=Brucella anthropi TaxID=529 RepID=UPI00124F13B9|nr:AAA family ATPase [Brucella anthropi]KAB2752118.1 AAA family ATPase [Brucella anthropi]
MMNEGVAVPEAVPVVAAPPEQKPPRIKTLTLCNFRAFAGQSPVSIPVKGKNVVIFGENGSGKSSIFHAMDGLFSIADKYPEDRRKRLANASNIFTRADPDSVSVTVEFEDEVKETWNLRGHPCNSFAAAGGSVSRVYAGAYRKAILDYRSILETNFRHSSGEINLFDVCVTTALRDYRTAYDGSEITLKELWDRLLVRLIPGVSRHVDPLRDAQLLSFNQGLREALQELVPTINAIMLQLGWPDVEIEQFDFSGIRYNREHQKRHRDYLSKYVKPILKFNGQTVTRPHLFLNEARLSALALAIYFAGRELCAKTNLADVPKIMVLDDIVISFDQSNRLPLLDLLAARFKDWQIFLLTHDRVWFDMTRSYHRRHQADRYWDYWELHSERDLKLPPVPTQVSSSAPKQAIDIAEEFLKRGHVNAAGNAARIATERALREFCDTKRVPIGYKNEIEKIPFSDLLEGAKRWSDGAAGGVYSDAISDVKMYSEILLNKLSHGGTPTLTEHEVRAAIVAVRSVLTALKVTSKFE